MEKSGPANNSAGPSKFSRENGGDEPAATPNVSAAGGSFNT